MKSAKNAVLLLAFVLVLSVVMPVTAAEHGFIVAYDYSAVVCVQEQQTVTMLSVNDVRRIEDASNLVVDIRVYSPIANLMRDMNEINTILLTEEMSNAINRHGFYAEAFETLGNIIQYDEKLIIAHQERIDEIIAFIEENGIEEIYDLHCFLEVFEHSNDFIGVTPFFCPGGYCIVTPVWIIISGVALRGWQCIRCGQLFVG